MLRQDSCRSLATTVHARPAAPRLNHTAEEISQGAKAVMAESTKLLDAAASAEIADDAILLFGSAENKIADAMALYGFYQYVSADASIRASSETVARTLSEFQIDASRRVDIFQQFSKSKAELEPQPSRFRKLVLAEMKRSGLALPKESRDKLASLEKELAALCLKFSSQLGADNSYLTFTTSELAGVPESVLSTFKKDSEDVYRVSFAPPEVQPVMRFCKVNSTREKLWCAHENRVPENRPLLARALELRQEIATELGRPTFGHYALEDTMAKTPERVSDFLEELLAKAKSAGVKERAALLALKQEEDPSATELFVWDTSYYSSILVEREYSVDDVEVSKYFALKETLASMLKVFERLLSIRFESVELDQSQKWHPDVTAYAVWKTVFADGDDAKPCSEEFCGFIYMDMHPRDNKYGHFANFTIIHGCDPGEDFGSYPLSALVCNFPRPAPGKPALMFHRDVITLFHELGHGIHAQLGLSQFARFAGTSVARDFVEAPSQLLEYWPWQPNLLANEFARHHVTGKPMPRELADAVARSKHANQAIFLLRQMFFGLYDLKAHTTNPKDFDITCWGNMYNEVTGLSGSRGQHGYGAFGHIMGGYECGYYGYLWAQVYAADIWQTIFSAEPMNSAAGLRYRNEVLLQGSSRDENDSLFALLGREPTNDAFLAELGV